MSKKMSMLEKLKAEKERLESTKSGTFERVDWYKPALGDNLVRIIPSTEKEGAPFVKVDLHFINVKKKDGTVAKGVPVRCYKELGEDSCPLCEYSAKLIKSSREEEVENGKRYRAQERYLYNVIDFANKKVVPYATGKTIHQQIVDYICDFEDEDVLSLEDGRNWKIVKKNKSGAKTAFNVEYSVRIDVKSSSVPPKLLPLVEGAIDLETLYQSKEEAIVKAFLGFVGADEEDDDDYVPPKKKKAPVEEEDDDDYVPAKKKASAPSKKKVVEEDEEEEDYVPPKKKKAPVVEEEEEEEYVPKKKPAKKVVEEEDEDEPAPKKKPAKKAVVEDDDLDLDDLGDYDDVDDALAGF